MKRFLCLLGLSLMLATMTYAAPTYDVGQEQSDQVQLVLTDAQPMTVDFVYACADNATITIATTAETEYSFYVATPMDVRTPVYDLTMPVFRLWCAKSYAFKSHLHTGWRGLNSNPPSQYYRA